MDSPPTSVPAAPAPHGQSGTGSAGSRDAVRTTELIISYVLRGGVLLSGGIILAGVIAFYVHFGSGAARVQADRAFPHSLAAVLQGVSQGSPLAIVTVGLLLLLVTPVLRVLVSILAFAIERDWRYVVITTLVLAILVFSFLLGKVGA